MFQTPSATLMRLDSIVIQLDVYNNFLLVSTKTRTYLCNTLQEQYKQIGKKLRDGNLGACFFYKCQSLNVKRGENGDRNLPISSKNDAASMQRDEVKIYCARPGSRLWEVNFDSSVVCTHQFRDSLERSATTLIHLDDNENSTLTISNLSDNIPPSFNFEKIFIFNEYILTFRVDGIYIFDIKTVSLLHWTNYFNNIKDIRILGNTIYIWLENNILKIITLLDIESFVTKVLSRKQYLLCAQFCLNWIDDISVLIDDNKLQVLKVLKEKLTDKKLAYDIEPLLKKLEDCKISSQQLENGIYVIDNVHHRENTNKSNSLLKKSVSICESNNLHVNVPVIKEALPLVATTNINTNSMQETDPSSDKNYLINILNTQYQFSKINDTATVPKFQELMQIKNLEELKEIFDLFLEYAGSESDAKRWITAQLLKFICLNITEHFKNLDRESKLFQFIFECFVYLNKSSELCKCLFPLSGASVITIQSYEVGCEIIEKSTDFITLCKEVPSMYRFVLQTSCQQNLISSLPLLIQYNDINLFDRYYKKFTYDMWDEAIKCIVKLESRICLNCDNSIKNNLNLSWNEFAKRMLHSIGGPSTLKLLSRYSQYIPTGALDIDFYQSCIFINSFSNSGNDVKDKYSKFLEGIDKTETNKCEFDLLILKYLKCRDAGENKRDTIPDLIDSKCSICDIPLKSPLFQDNTKLMCGHFSHKICAISNNVCNNCSTRI